MPLPRFLILAMACFAIPAQAQKAELPVIAIGSRWQFAEYYTAPTDTANRSWIITSVAPGGIEGTENGEPLLLTDELNVRESPRGTYSNLRALSFPLEIGKRWQYRNDWVFKAKNSRGTLLMDVAVTGHERIKVPAGEFDAFKLVARGTLGGMSPINSHYAGEITETYWYAPRARTIVRSVRHNPYLGTTTVDLVGFQLPD